MIGRSLDVVGPQHGSQFFHLLARKAVNDAALPRILHDELDDLLVDVLGFLAHLIVEVGTVERALELRCAHNGQILHNVGAHLVGGRSGEGNDRRFANLVDNGTYAAVFRAEIVPPLRNAVRLVNSIKRYLHRLEEIYVLLLVERFGCHVEQLRLTGHNVAAHLVDGRFVERRVEVVGHAVFLAHAVDDVHLVFHQRYERRYNDGCAFHNERWQLIAERFSAARRHQHKCVFPVEDIPDDGFLVALERVETKILFQ